jgi:transcriptional regulator with XRE-family HTH domain
MDEFHPLFADHSLEYLGRRLNRSEEYLVDLKHGRKPVTAHFVKNASQVFNVKYDELFDCSALPETVIEKLGL